MAFLLPVDPHDNDAYRAYKALMELRRNRRQVSRWTGRWFRQNGDEVFGPWNLALGRYQWYRPFAQHCSVRNGAESLLINDMIRVDTDDRYANLRWYLEKAARFDVNLQGVSVKDLRKAVRAGSAQGDLKALRLSYVTGWEINQLVHTADWLELAWWHAGSDLTAEQVHKAFDGRVSRERILEVQ